MLDLKKGVQYIKGVGPNRAVLLNKLGMFTLEDVINYFPRMYEDRSKPTTIINAIDGEEVLIQAKVVSGIVQRRVRKGLIIFKVLVQDESGQCEITWYNQTYLKDKIKRDKIYKFYGKIKNTYGKIEMNSPIVEEMEKSKNTGKIVPIYPLTYNLSQNVLRGIIENAINEVKMNLPETLPEYLVEKYNVKAQRRHNTKELNRLVDEIKEHENIGEVEENLEILEIFLQLLNI